LLFGALPANVQFSRLLQKTDEQRAEASRKSLTGDLQRRTKPRAFPFLNSIADSAR
jgi:hypothetical protein